MSDTTVPEPAPIGGGCLCGAVRYELRSAQREGYYCHCRMCQLAFGNTRAAFVNVKCDEVRWLAEPAYYASSKIARRGFCSRCGTPLTFEYLGSPRLDLSVGSFDDPALFRPASHFAIETRIAPWHVDDGLPGQTFASYTALVDRWKKAYGDGAEPGLDTARRG
jgi:hypothetical protein